MRKLWRWEKEQDCGQSASTEVVGTLDISYCAGRGGVVLAVEIIEWGSIHKGVSRHYKRRALSTDGQ